MSYRAGKMQFVKASIALAALTPGSCLLAGCHEAPRDLLHITAAAPDQPVDVVGKYHGKTYSLSVDRTPQPLYLAYYEPIDTDDVGRDFHAVLNPNSGFMEVDVPGRGRVNYSVRSVQESH